MILPRLSKDQRDTLWASLFFFAFALLSSCAEGLATLILG